MQLGHVYWIGGGGGSGQSTIARRLVAERALQQCSASRSCFALACASGLQDPRDLGVATLTSVRERRDAVAVGQIHVRTGRDEEPHDLGMTLTAVAEDDGLEQRGPTEPVDVVDLDRRSQELTDYLDVAAICRTNEPGAVVAVEAVDIRARAQGEPEHLEAAIRGRDEVRALLA